ncbi:hypothetical protein HU200_055681 [Digitaria exilis]|uniref:Uncharacterized protein n=1 Tax=Digitaria exilis TaxID=1010633 RepID=A0A835E1I3_9POAL|nr:hypothetical protein HU200_055681 [Digitaria exilis]
MGVSVSGSRCLKLLLLLTLLPLALRAASLLLLGASHAAPPLPHWRSPTGGRITGGDASAAADAARASVSAAGSAHGRRTYTTQTRHRRRRTESALAAVDGERRLSHADADGGGEWFEDDKRLAPTGSNPLHNLR